jgi:polysaccharide chain length determinant protein (PEP-CTERM system associated)
MPDLYRSDALISVVPPKVPASMVPNVAPAQSLEDRIPAIRNEILSRTRLERIIQDLDLYTAERRTGIMEDIVERMRDDIIVTPVAGAAIRVGFIGRDPRTVQRVADRIAALFMDESTRDRKLQIENTDQFLETSLKDAEARLSEREKALEEYRKQHAGELPEQVAANLQALQTNQANIQALDDAMDRARERRLVLERQITDLENQAETTPLETPAAGAGAPTTAQQLTAARAALVQAQLTYTADHPEVVRLKGLIKNLEAKQEQEEKDAPVSGGVRAMSPAEQQRQRRLQDARDNLAELDRQMARDQTTIEDLKKKVEEYQRRAEAAPTRQTEMVGMNRDYGILTQVYSNLLSQKEQTNIAANLERREIGEQFRLIDQARVPAAPFSPQRDRLNFAGMGAGLALGVLIVGVLEYRDSTFKTDEDLSQLLGIHVFAVVPLIQSDAERKRAWRRRMALGAVMGSVVIGCLAIFGYTLVR